MTEKYQTLEARMHPETQAGGRELFFQGCASTLWEIDVVRASSWNGHIPFMFLAFQLLQPRRYVELGCHDGGSLFAACQASARLNTETECIAIDTWEGDAHSGHYGPEVLDSLRKALSDNGHEHATLMQTLFDSAVSSFDDASIDLLLIDGLHTYEAVKHDFETWLPKVAAGGVIMLHDTTVHERDFGVWKLWQELQEDFETWHFAHSHGLGVLFVPGPETPLTACVNYLRENPDAANHLQDLLETVGERSISHNHLAAADERARIWHESARKLEAEIQSLRTQVLALGDERAELIAHYEGLKVMRLMQPYWALRGRFS